MTLYEQSLLLLERRQQELDPSDFNIIYFGDSWVGEKGYTSNAIFQAALEEAKRHRPLLIMHGGDIVYTGLEENFRFFIERKEEFAPDIPMFVAIGNHEVDRSVPPGPAGVENYQQTIGPLHFALSVPRYNLTLIALNTLYRYVYGQYGLTDAELSYLYEKLQHRYLNTFVAMHVPPRTDEWEDPGEYFTIGSDGFFNEVENKVSSVLVSHVHAYDTAKYRHTKLYLSGGGGAPLNKDQIFHIMVVNIKNKNAEKSKINVNLVPIGYD